MPQRQEEADRDWTFSFLHELAGHVVDRRDVIRIEAVTKAEAAGENGSSGGVFEIPMSEHLLYRAGFYELPNSTAFPDWCMTVRQAARQPRSADL